MEDIYDMIYAMIPNGTNIVSGTIVMSPGFEFEGYYFVHVPRNVWCDAGTYYNKADGLFYYDEAFTHLGGVVIPEQPEEPEEPEMPK